MNKWIQLRSFIRSLNLIIFFISQGPFLFGQAIPSKYEHGMENLFSVIFNKNSINYSQKGKIELPGFYNQVFDKDEIAVVFQKEFTVEDENSKLHLVIENGGIDDVGLVRINGEIIQENNNQKKTKTVYFTGNTSFLEIPKSIIKKGEGNLIQIYTLNVSDAGYIGNSLYLIDEKQQRISLNGIWEYQVYDQKEFNYRVKPSHNISLFPYYDFKPQEYTRKDFNDLSWGETDFPNTFERIFSRKFIDGAFWIRKQIVLDNLLNEDYFFEVPDGIDDADYLYVNGFLVGLTNCYYCNRRYRIPKNFLRKDNIFSLLIFDNLGEGGIRGPMYLSNSKEQINISKNWRFKQIFDLEILLTVKETDDFSTPLYQKSYSIFDLNGKTLNKDELLISENYQTFLLIIIILLVSALLFLIFRLIQLNSRINLPKNPIETNNKKQDHIFIRSNRIDHKVEINDIFSVESKKDYVKITTSSENFLVRKNLKTFLLELPDQQFIRISKSIALNIQKVEKIDKNTIYLSSGYHYEIGKVYLKKINALLKKI